MIKDPFLSIKHMSAPCHTAYLNLNALNVPYRYAFHTFHSCAFPSSTCTVFVVILRKLVWALAVRESSETELTRPLFRHLGNELAKRQEAAQGETSRSH